MIDDAPRRGRSDQDAADVAKHLAALEVPDAAVSPVRRRWRRFRRALAVFGVAFVVAILVKVITGSDASFMIGAGAYLVLDWLNERRR